MDELGHDGWDSAAVGFHRDAYRPRPSRRRRRSTVGDPHGDGADVSDVFHGSRETPQDAPGENARPASPAAKTGGEPKKPGRKRKARPDEGPSGGRASAPDAPAADAGAAEGPREKPRRKRGRPRKGESARAREAPSAADAAADVDAVRPDSGNADDRPAEENGTADGPGPPEVRAEEGLDPRRPDVAGTCALAARVPETAADDSGPAAAPPPREPAGEALRPASSQAPGKGLYRVGLSKKSRLPPLLKSIRK